MIENPTHTDPPISMCISSPLRKGHLSIVCKLLRSEQPYLLHQAPNKIIRRTTISKPHPFHEDHMTTTYVYGGHMDCKVAMRSFEITVCKLSGLGSGGEVYVAEPACKQSRYVADLLQFLLHLEQAYLSWTLNFHLAPIFMANFKKRSLCSWMAARRSF